jgi:3-hydroxyisobutyrate dehydrogenase-like beta-hydroxyacid dehydrogenase
MRVAVLGLGEAGSRLAGDLANEGLDVAGYDPARASESAADIESAVAESDIVLSVNSVAVAAGVAGTAAPALRSDAV